VGTRTSRLADTHELITREYCLLAVIDGITIDAASAVAILAFALAAGWASWCTNAKLVATAIILLAQVDGSAIQAIALISILTTTIASSASPNAPRIGITPATILAGVHLSCVGVDL